MIKGIIISILLLPALFAAAVTPQVLIDARNHGVSLNLPHPSATMKFLDGVPPLITLEPVSLPESALSKYRNITK